MYRALYDFSSEEEDVLPVRAGEKFIFIQEHDSNWWKMQGEEGLVGLVPASYLEPDENEMNSPETRRAVLKSIERAMEAIHAQAANNGGAYTNEQRSNLKKLLGHRKSIISQKKDTPQKRTAPKPPQKIDNEPPPQPRRQAPCPPTNVSHTCSKGESSKSLLSSDEETSRLLESGSRSMLYSEASQGSLKQFEVVVPPWFVTSLLEELRLNSGISYKGSFTVTETVLRHIKNEIPILSEPMDKIIQEVIKEKENDFHSDESLLLTHDGKNIETILKALTVHKDDSQQRSWALHMDEPVILEQLTQLLALLADANQEVSKAVIGQNDFEYLQSMVAYFQMEHRQMIRLQLLQVFGCICGIDKDVVTQLLCSVLPGELSRAIQAAQDDLQLQLYSSLVLTMIFSTAETVPYSLYDQLNNDFVNFLIYCIENAPEGEQGDQIVDSFVGLILSFNQHFTEPTHNIVMDVLAACRTAKNLSEKVMLIFNRGEDPALMFQNYPRNCTNSVVKFLSDVFSSRRTSGLFFTSDMMVLLEIILRQITDLNPGNNMRTEYLSLLHLILTNTDYFSHNHLESELNTILKRIDKEEEELESQKDKYIVMEIFKQFPDHFGS